MPVTWKEYIKFNYSKVKHLPYKERFAALAKMRKKEVGGGLFDDGIDPSQVTTLTLDDANWEAFTKSQFFKKLPKTDELESQRQIVIQNEDGSDQIFARPANGMEADNIVIYMHQHFMPDWVPPNITAETGQGLDFVPKLAEKDYTPADENPTYTLSSEPIFYNSDLYSTLKQAKLLSRITGPKISVAGQVPPPKFKENRIIILFAGQPNSKGLIVDCPDKATTIQVRNALIAQGGHSAYTTGMKQAAEQSAKSMARISELTEHVGSLQSAMEQKQAELLAAQQEAAFQTGQSQAYQQAAQQAAQSSGGGGGGIIGDVIGGISSLF